MPRTSPSGPKFILTGDNRFAHMSFETSSPFVIVGSGAGPVEIYDNPPTVYSPPSPPTLNGEFAIINPSGDIKRLQWQGEEMLVAMVSYYGTFQLAGGGTSLCALSLAVNGVPDADKILLELSGNRPNFVGNTSLIQVAPDDALSLVIENTGGSTDVQVYSAHLSVVSYISGEG